MLRLVIMPVISGFIATAGMTAFLYAVNRTAWTNADMVRAVGSLFTRSYENALGIGLVVHFVNGMIIAALYLHILSLLAQSNFAFEVFIGGCIGFAQGFVVSWAIVRFAYRHPVPAFQKADFKVAVAHHAGHVVYGLLIGAMFGILRLAGFDVSPGI